MGAGSVEVHVRRNETSSYRFRADILGNPRREWVGLFRYWRSLRFKQTTIARPIPLRICRIVKTTSRWFSTATISREEAPYDGKNTYHYESTERDWNSWSRGGSSALVSCSFFLQSEKRWSNGLSIFLGGIGVTIGFLRVVNVDRVQLNRANFLLDREHKLPVFS